MCVRVVCLIISSNAKKLWKKQWGGGQEKICGTFREKMCEGGI